LRQQLTVVTGGSRGIGAAVCARLAVEGHDVVIGYRSDEAAAHEVAEAIRAAGRRSLAVRLDTADERSVDRLFDSAAELGTVTGLVNNAGISGPGGRLADADAEGMRRALEVNVWGYLLCARRAVRDMTGSGGGAIVNISSAAATLGSPGQYVHYAATKAAVDAMTTGLSKEVAADGIRVNCVAPGTIWTDFHAKVAALPMCPWAGPDSRRRSPARSPGSSRTTRRTPRERCCASRAECRRRTLRDGCFTAGAAARRQAHRDGRTGTAVCPLGQKNRLSMSEAADSLRRPAPVPVEDA
jgi:NAD(P)-dependent dehydrogenase (short-subunit alcohol dehydrogenase family)